MTNAGKLREAIEKQREVRELLHERGLLDLIPNAGYVQMPLHVAESILTELEKPAALNREPLPDELWDDIKGLINSLSKLENPNQEQFVAWKEGARKIKYELARTRGAEPQPPGEPFVRRSGETGVRPFKDTSLDATKGEGT